MKKIITKVMAIVALSIAVASCGDGEGNFKICQILEQEATLPGEQADTVVVLDGVTTDVNKVIGQVEWLNVRREGFDQGQASVRLTAQDNETGALRRCTVTVCADMDFRVVLTVTQAVKEAKPDSPGDTDDVVTDKPAYSRRE